jgi:hypothetical protein
VVIKYALSTMGLQSLSDLVEIYILQHRSDLAYKLSKMTTKGPRWKAEWLFRG